MYVYVGLSCTNACGGLQFRSVSRRLDENVLNGSGSKLADLRLLHYSITYSIYDSNIFTHYTYIHIYIYIYIYIS